MNVSPEELRQNYELPEDDDALLKECDVVPFRASGPGGQHRNKTLTAVRLLHRPSGLVVIGRRERSLTRNLQDAVARLRMKLEKLLVEPKVRRPTKPRKAAIE
ncbi:MAG TPA: peptide chain release factor-like protein, partial [Candidatus Eisenbacteria bacterium]|nr:peptide chain release factor-like protein [Candidatus Eisenbacteria bacterium]